MMLRLVRQHLDGCRICWFGAGCFYCTLILACFCLIGLDCFSDVFSVFHILLCSLWCFYHFLILPIHLFESLARQRNISRYRFPLEDGLHVNWIFWAQDASAGFDDAWQELVTSFCCCIVHLGFEGLQRLHWFQDLGYWFSNLILPSL